MQKKALKASFKNSRSYSSDLNRNSVPDVRYRLSKLTLQLENLTVLRLSSSNRPDSVDTLLLRVLANFAKRHSVEFVERIDLVHLAAHEYVVRLRL